MNVIEVNDLNKSFFIKKKGEGLVKSLFKPEYKEIKAVHDLSFNIQEGECVAFIGPNGAGKSTTIKMLTSILHPTSGSASVLGLNPFKERKKLTYQIGAVFGQRSQLWYHLPAGKTFHLLASVYDIPDSEANKRIKHLIKEFEIGDFINKPVRTLSLGERMRCEIVASLIHNPKILFLDEPTIGLDVTAKGIIRELLKRQAKETGTTVLLTSHDTGDMESVCERVIIINKGQLVIDKPVNKLKQEVIKTKCIVVTRPNGNQETICIDTTKTPIEQAMTEVIASGNFVDLTVEDPPMEDIIKTIYKSGVQ